MSTPNESRPQADLGAAKSFGGDYDQITTLARLTPRESRLWNDGYQWGRTHGLEDGFKQGYQKCDEEISTLQREAARIVHHMAGIEPRDVEADNAAAAERELWWAKKRGEVA